MKRTAIGALAILLTLSAIFAGCDSPASPAAGGDGTGTGGGDGTGGGGAATGGGGATVDPAARKTWTINYNSNLGPNKEPAGTGVEPGQTSSSYGSWLRMIDEVPVDQYTPGAVPHFYGDNPEWFRIDPNDPDPNKRINLPDPYTYVFEGPSDSITDANIFDDFLTDNHVDPIFRYETGGDPVWIKATLDEYRDPSKTTRFVIPEGETRLEPIATKEEYDSIQIDQEYDLAHVGKVMVSKKEATIGTPETKPVTATPEQIADNSIVKTPVYMNTGADTDWEPTKDIAEYDSIENLVELELKRTREDGTTQVVSPPEDASDLTIERIPVYMNTGAETDWDPDILPVSEKPTDPSIPIREVTEGTERVDSPDSDASNPEIVRIPVYPNTGSEDDWAGATLIDIADYEAALADATTSHAVRQPLLGQEFYGANGYDWYDLDNVDEYNAILDPNNKREVLSATEMVDSPAEDESDPTIERFAVYSATGTEADWEESDVTEYEAAIAAGKPDIVRRNEIPGEPTYSGTNRSNVELRTTNGASSIVEWPSGVSTDGQEFGLYININPDLESDPVYEQVGTITLKRVSGTEFQIVGQTLTDAYVGKHLHNVAALSFWLVPAPASPLVESGGLYTIAAPNHNGIIITYKMSDTMIEGTPTYTYQKKKIIGYQKYKVIGWQEYRANPSYVMKRVDHYVKDQPKVIGYQVKKIDHYLKEVPVIIYEKRRVDHYTVEVPNEIAWHIVIPNVIGYEKQVAELAWQYTKDEPYYEVWSPTDVWDYAQDFVFPAGAPLGDIKFELTDNQEGELVIALVGAPQADALLSAANIYFACFDASAAIPEELGEDCLVGFADFPKVLEYVYEAPGINPKAPGLAKTIVIQCKLAL